MGAEGGYAMLNAQIQRVWNNALTQNYQALLHSKDFQRKRLWETQYTCCDAYHLRNQPENIRCCVLGQRYGV